MKTKVKQVQVPGFVAERCESMYPNQYTTAAIDQNAGGEIALYTRNYYVGNQRTDPGGADPEVDDVYYYGTDHLGSSTYVTDNNADVIEHIEYTPWGGQRCVYGDAL